MRFDNSEECMKSELDIFTVPPTQTSIEKGIWCKVEANDGYKSSTSTTSFHIKPISDGYIDFSENFLHLKCSIRKKHPTDATQTVEIDKNDKIGPINNFFHSIFSQIEVKLNGISVENSNSMYPYRAYFENLMNYDESIQNRLLNNEIYYTDTAGKMESCELSDIPESYTLNEAKDGILKRFAEQKVNQGFIARRNRFMEDGKPQVVEMCGKLHINLASASKYLLNNVGVEIILTRSSPKFCLLGNNGDYSVYIHEAYLRYRKINFVKSVEYGHTLGLLKSNAKYPYKEVKMNSVSIPAQSETLTIKSIHNGISPNRILIGFVETTSFSGDYPKNPFNFQNFGLESMLVQVAGENVPYNEELKFNYNDKQYALAYNSLFQGHHIAKNISYEDYDKGYTIYAFNLTPDLCSLNHFNMQKTGDISITVKFKKTDLNIHAVFYLEFDNILELTDKRVPIAVSS